MPNIKSGADLRNDFAEAYEQMKGRLELYSKLIEGLDDIQSGNTKPLNEAMQSIREKRSKRP